MDNEEIKVGDTVEVIDDSGARASEIGQILVVSYAESDNGNPMFDWDERTLEFKGTDMELCQKRVKKVGKHRHPHAALINQWADDTSLEFESKVGMCDWQATTHPAWSIKTKYRIKPKKSPKELELEGILGAMKILEERLKKLEVV